MYRKLPVMRTTMVLEALGSSAAPDNSVADCKSYDHLKENSTTKQVLPVHVHKSETTVVCVAILASRLISIS